MRQGRTGGRKSTLSPSLPRSLAPSLPRSPAPFSSSSSLFLSFLLLTQLISKTHLINICVLNLYALGEAALVEQLGDIAEEDSEVEHAAPSNENGDLGYTSRKSNASVMHASPRLCEAWVSNFPSTPASDDQTPHPTWTKRRWRISLLSRSCQ